MGNSCVPAVKQNISTGTMQQTVFLHWLKGTLRFAIPDRTLYSYCTRISTCSAICVTLSHKKGVHHHHHLLATMCFLMNSFIGNYCCKKLDIYHRQKIYTYGYSNLEPSAVGHFKKHLTKSASAKFRANNKWFDRRTRSGGNHLSKFEL